jgi:hypothetical protein
VPPERRDDRDLRVLPGLAGKRWRAVCSAGVASGALALLGDFLACRHCPRRCNVNELAHPQVTHKTVHSSLSAAALCAALDFTYSPGGGCAV